jgi:sigma-B regulation protein RsbU (phosphoserine phosphatase)
LKDESMLVSREKEQLEKLERELNLKQLQIKSLLAITQAINDNVSASGLFNMYKSFISWEMGIHTMALFVKNEVGWNCVAESNVDEALLVGGAEKLLLQFSRLHTIKDSDPEELQVFDIIIPVYHKDTSIAYSLIGGIKEQDDIYNKIQFITTITNIIAVAIENKRLFNQQIAQEALKREMELASTVQKMLIPEFLPQGEGYELASIYKPHSNVGGDYFDLIQYDPQRFAFCIADISGKGVAAALLMANFQANLRSLIYQYRDLETFVLALNEAVYRITKSDKFITLFVAEINLQTRELKYINAGHFPPFIVNDGKVKRLEKGCTIIGAFDQLPSIEMGCEKLSKEGIILTFTDGLTDLKSPSGEYFEEQQIDQFVRKNQHLSAHDFNQVLLNELEEFRGNEDYPDDIAVLTCKYF